MNARDTRLLIAHVVFRFDIGGLENGVVNLVNGLPENEFRHVVIALTEATDFRRRIARDDVTVYEIGKRPGKDPGAYLRLYRLLSELHPDIVHTRNLATLECALVAALARVPVRIHGEHGWDVHDPDGKILKYKVLRRICNPFIQQFVAVSRDLGDWLVTRVGIPARKVLCICNGVDTQRFRPAAVSLSFASGIVRVGSVTRFEEIKDPLNLVRAFVVARRRLTDSGVDLRLLMPGDGPLRAEAMALLESEGAAVATSLPGNRNDLPELLRTMNLFVLGSRREGISNTILEAMATGLPVIASATGGNLELVVPEATGKLVPPGDMWALSDAMVTYATDARLRAEHGRVARTRAEQEYSLARMLVHYRRLYADCGAARGAAA